MSTEGGIKAVIAALIANLTLGVAHLAIDGAAAVTMASVPTTLPALVALLAMQLPMTLAMTRRAGLSMLAFVPLGALRAFVRGAGAFHGSIDRFRGAGAIAARRLRRREERA